MAEVPTEPRGVMVEGYDKDGKDVTVFDNTGGTRTEPELRAALQEYNKTGTNPTGYLVLQPGAVRGLRTVFEAINQPLQKGLAAAGKIVGEDLSPSGFAALAEHLGIAQPGAAVATKQTGGEIGEAAGKMVGSSVATPNALGMTLGMGAAGRMLGPTSLTTGAGQQVALKMGMIANAFKTGVGGATGALLTSAAMGEPPTVDRALVDFAAATATGGLQAGFSHLINKTFRPSMHQEVTKEILGDIVEQYPNAQNIVDIAASNPHKLSMIASRGVQALKKENEDVAKEGFALISGELKGVNPSVGQQNTLRALVRDFTRAGTEMLDSVGNDTARTEANAAFLKARGDLAAHIDTLFPGELTKVQQFTKDRVGTYLLGYENSLTKYVQGAEVLALLKQSGADEGFNMNRFAEAIKTQYTKASNPLLSRVGNTVGQGESLVDIPTVEPNRMTNSVLDFFKNKIPVIGKYLHFGDGPKVSSALPWQRPKTPIPEILVGQEAGQAAIREFLGRGKD